MTDYGAYLDEAARKGVYVITEGCNDNLQGVKAFLSKPAVLGWNIADDAGKHASAASVAMTRSAIGAIDPDHMTYISVALLRDIVAYGGTADWVGEQDYPIGQGAPLGEVHYVSTKLKTETQKYATAAIPNLQSFAWTGQRWPTPDELFNMTFQAVVANANGILYYTYFDSSNAVADHPDIWTAAKEIVREIKVLSPVMLEGNYSKLSTGAGNAFAARWGYRGATYVVVVNSNAAASNVTIPTGATGWAHAVFAGRPSGLSFSAGTLSGSIPGNEVHVYRVDATM